MDAKQLTFPDVMDWCTTGGAARILNVDRSTITRMISGKQLTAHYPRRGPGERVMVLIPYVQVEQLRVARDIALNRG